MTPRAASAVSQPGRARFGILIGLTVGGCALVLGFNRPAPTAAGARGDAAPSSDPAIQTLPDSRGGQDLVGTRMPELGFDRWLNAGGGEAAEGRRAESGGERAVRATLYRWWTNGCPFCEKSLPAIEAFRKKYGPDGLRVVAVYHPKPPREVDDDTIRRHARKLGYTGTVAVDLDWSELKRVYLSTGERRATSVSFLVDSDGVIRFVHPGTEFFPSEDPDEAQQNEDHRLLERAIAALVGGARASKE